MIILHLILTTLLLPIVFVIQLLARIRFGVPKIEIVDYSLYNPFQLSKVDELSLDDKGKYGKDSCKFKSMQFYASELREDWDYIRENFFDYENLTFYRGKEYNDTAFSGDMMSGLLLAISKAYKMRIISSYDIDFIAKALFKLVFKELIPFRFAHTDYSRGYIVSFFICNGISMMCLSILKMGFEFSIGWRKYLFLVFYYVYMIVNFPNLLFGIWDRCLFWDKVRSMWTYSTHSDALVYASACILDIPFAKSGLEFLYKHHFYNIDFRALYYEHVESPTQEEYNDILLELSVLQSSRDPSSYPFSNTKYFELRKLEWQYKHNEFISGRRCQNNTTWERCPQSRGSANENDSDIDIYFGGKILSRINVLISN